jgi:hypothetical protein
MNITKSGQRPPYGSNHRLIPPQQYQQPFLPPEMYRQLLADVRLYLQGKHPDQLKQVTPTTKIHHTGISPGNHDFVEG